jgi:hypothetical protein
MKERKHARAKMAGKRVGLLTERALNVAKNYINVGEPGAKRLGGEVASLCEFLVEAEIAFLVAGTERDEELASQEIQNLLAQIEEEAGQIALAAREWAKKQKS